MTGGDGIHEGTQAFSKTPSASERSFGITFAVVFAIIGSWPLMDGEAVRWWSLTVAAGFLIVALTRPGLLKPFNRVWMAFANLLHRVVTPLVMAILFYLSVTPIALLMRLFGKMPIPLRFDPQAKSYWILRTPPGPAPDTMKNQF